MRAALIDGEGNVVNVIEYDPEADYTPDEGLTLRELKDDQPVGPGWTHTETGFVAPEPPAAEPEATT